MHLFNTLNKTSDIIWYDARLTFWWVAGWVYCKKS